MARLPGRVAGVPHAAGFPFLDRSGWFALVKGFRERVDALQRGRDRLGSRLGGLDFQAPVSVRRGSGGRRRTTPERSVLGSALARSPPYRARSLNQARRVCPVVAAVSRAALVPT
jgi:hypothetical protein